MSAETVRHDNSTKKLAHILPTEKGTKGAEPLAGFINNIASKKVPVSSFSRMWLLGSLQAKVALGYFAYWLRSRFASDNQKEQLRNEAHLAAALKLLATMGYMRGAVMKVGQMLANLPTVMPDEFAEVMGALHFEAPAMHYPMVREVFLDEFGREPEEMFETFEHQAFAAASLGQVHRARLHSGEEVAVKIQYPNIARTVTSDLRNVRALLRPMQLTHDWQDIVDKLDDMEQMLLRETDYVQEADFTRTARTFFSPEDKIVVPRVFDDFSSAKILTTEFLDGCHLKEFLATDPSQEQRDYYTDLLVRKTLRTYYKAHWVLADPNPGNFLFMDNGRLGMIDFGCIRVLTDEEWEIQCEAELANQADDRKRLDHVIARACLYDSPDEMTQDHRDSIYRCLFWQLEPFTAEGLFDFGDHAFFRRGIDSMMAASRKEYTRGAPVYVWTNRFLFASRAVIYQLRGRAEFKKIRQEESAGLFPPDSLTRISHDHFSASRRIDGK